MGDVIWSSSGWAISVPERPVTPTHLTLVAAAGVQLTGLPAVYDRARAALQLVAGCDGFTLSFGHHWTPEPNSIGEAAEPAAGQIFNLYGRSTGELIKPLRILAMPGGERPSALDPAERSAWIAQLRRAFPIAAPEAEEAGQSSPTCACCHPAPGQSRWHRAGASVLAYREPAIVEAGRLVVPTRHVRSIADLTAAEIESIGVALDETLTQLNKAHGSTGLS